MALVGVTDIVARLDPQPGPETYDRIGILIDDAEEKIRRAFLKEGRFFDSEVLVTPWLDGEAKDVIREMVSAAIIIGPNAGVRSASSTTGPQSDSVTYADVGAVTFSGVRLTDAQKEALGLFVGAYPRGDFPAVKPWPEWESR